MENKLLNLKNSWIKKGNIAGDISRQGPVQISLIPFNYLRARIFHNPFYDVFYSLNS